MFHSILFHQIFKLDTGMAGEICLLCFIMLNSAEEGNGMEMLKCHTVYGWADFPHLIKFKVGLKCHSCLD